MQGPHCARCAAYEDRVIAKPAGAGLPPDVVPCADFVMSDRFRDWAVGEMRREVLGQVSMAGLDRMAIVKDGRPARPARPDPDASGAPSDGGPGQSHQSRNK